MLFARYLRLLGVPRRAPGLDALREIVAAHLTRVPFENVSKLLMRRGGEPPGVPDLERFLDGIERRHLGGTCYSNNHHLYRLLQDLGYDVAFCGADMSRPDVHVVCVVTLAGRPYLVDGGYGSPFLAPMPLDLDTDLEIVLGRERYVLRPRDVAGRSRMDMYRDGALRHGYEVNPTPRRIEEFARVIEDSFAPSATFMNSVVIARFYPGRSVVLHNLTLIEAEGPTFREHRLAGRDVLPNVIEEHFGIPRHLVLEALDGVVLSEDAWG